jgi:hypothetical protein
MAYPATDLVLAMACPLPDIARIIRKRREQAVTVARSARSGEGGVPFNPAVYVLTLAG